MFSNFTALSLDYVCSRKIVGNCKWLLFKQKYKVSSLNYGESEKDTINIEL